MINTILLPINPTHVDNIFMGDKCFELRRVIHKRSMITTVLVYCTAPVSKVVGEFTIGEILYLDLISLWNRTKKYNCVDEDHFFSYFANKDCGYALEIIKPLKYKYPHSLEKYNISNAPQSFVYISDINRKKTP